MSKIFRLIFFVSPISSKSSATFISGIKNQCDCNSQKVVDADSRDVVRYSDHVTREIFEYSERSLKHLQPTSKSLKLHIFLGYYFSQWKNSAA